MLSEVLRLTTPAPPLLASGAWFKNTVCAVRGIASQLCDPVGDLNDAAACRAHEAAMAAALDWLGATPRVIAHDLHPDFHSSRHAAALAARLGARALPVQHHHAHIGAVCAEHGWHAPILGLALDGVGLGTDNTPWGGELLRVDGARCERLGHLAPLALPGGDRAAREPWRMAAAVLFDLGRGGEIAARYAAEPATATLLTMLERNLNSPRTSSAGRLFDAAAGLLGLCDKMQFDAEAAVALEKAATEWLAHSAWPVAQGGWRLAEGRLDLRPLLGELADTTDAGAGAARFHATLVAALAEWTQRAADSSGIDTVALGGGCFFNRILAGELRRTLEARGLRVLGTRQLVPGDAGLAPGQAWIALHSLDD